MVKTCTVSFSMSFNHRGRSSCGSAIGDPQLFSTVLTAGRQRLQRSLASLESDSLPGHVFGCHLHRSMISLTLHGIIDIGGAELYRGRPGTETGWPGTA